jgi:hypothetical protein
MSLDPEPPELPSPSVPPVLALESVASTADHAATHATGAAGHHGPFHSHCENCATTLEGPFCHRCGQHDFEFHRSFWHVFLEALENLFHFEGKFFRNIVTLLFQPGRLTADFNGGKRAAQMPPFRLYVFVSFLFFLLIFLGGDAPAAGPKVRAGDPMVAANLGEAWRAAASSMKPGDWKDPAKVNQAVNQAVEQATGDAAALAVEPKSFAEGLRKAAGEARVAAEQAETEEKPASGRTKLTREQTGFIRYLEQQARRMDDPAYRQRLGASIKSHLPHMLMFCLPFFALYTRLLFRKSGQVYLQHLVVAVHFHTFIYLWILFARGWTFVGALPGWGLDGWIGFACNAWLGLYPLLMLRRLFANSWIKTLVKTCLLAGIYTTTLALGFVAMAAIIFLSS